jgi:sugar (pentulose or hexulose) kinase
VRGLSPDIACLSFGTTATLNLCSNRYKTPQTLMPPFPGAVPNTYSLEWMIYRGFWMVTWFIEQFSDAEKRLAQAQGKKVEDILEALAAKVPPGSMGLTLQPYWSPGRQYPGPEAKGAIIGFGDVHEKGHLYRALLEGLAYALKQGLEQLQKRTGILVKELRVSGGGSQSDLAMQITADVFGLPVHRQKTHETSALGAAVNVAVGLGYYPDYQTAVDCMTGSHQVFLPNLKHHSLYQHFYQQVYRPLYPRLAPLYQAVQKITGYPSAYS